MSGSWRKYTFFEKEVVSENLSDALACNVTTIVAEGGILLFGDENGCITIAGRDFHGQQSDKKETKQVFRGRIYGLSYLIDIKNQSRQYIVAIGEDNPNFIPRSALASEEKGSSSIPVSNQSTNFTTIKILNASDLSRPLLSFSAGFTGLPVHAKVSASCVLHDGSSIVVGYSNGAIALFVGCFLKDGTPATRPVVAQVLLQEHVHPVSGLFFSEFNSIKSTTDSQIRLFVVFDTDSTINDPLNIVATANSDIGGITVYDVSTTSSTSGVITLSAGRSHPNILDDRGAARLCSCYVKDTKELVVGRNEGIFSYSVEDRGRAAGFEGEKQCVSAVGRYILVASLDQEKSRRNNITIYDLRNKFIAFSGQISAGENVSSVAHDGGIAYILTTTQLLLRYRERDTASKVEVLLKKSLFSVAISLAMEEQADLSEVMKLYKMYGDHLYKKGDYDAAMNQFIATIGYVQSSYVIRRYLEPHRILNLVTYLEKICERGFANKEHKTLLLTCYTKLKDDEKIRQFLQTHQPSGQQKPNISVSVKASTGTGATTASSTQPVAAVVAVVPALSPEAIAASIDSAACVDVLKTAGYIEYALQLAAYHGHHNNYIELQISKPGSEGVEAALVYLVSLALVLPFQSFMSLLMNHIPTILDKNPQAATGLLIKLCRGDVDSFRNIISTAAASNGSHINSIKGATNAISGTSSQSFIPVPIEDLFHVYVDHDEYLKILIEGVYCDVEGNRMSSGFHNRVLPVRVMNTLLELYLDDYDRLRSSLIDSSNQTYTQTELKLMEGKIMSLLDGHPNEYDLDRAMSLMYAYNFDSGTRYLLERTMSTPLLIRKCIETNDDRGILKILRREGSKDSELYVQILMYFVRRSIQDPNDEERWDSISEVMSMIEKEAALTPAQVISILSLNPDLPLNIASKYIFKVLQELHDDNEILQYNVETARNSIAGLLTEESARKQLESIQGPKPTGKKLKSSGTNRRTQGMSNYGDDDDDENDDEDIDLHRREKLAEQKKWDSILKAQMDRATDHESFYTELEHSSDGFATIAGYFGKTIIFESNIP